MRPFYGMLQEMMQDVAVPAIKGASTANRKAGRVGCGFFSLQMVDAWPGFRAPDQISRKDFGDHVLQDKRLGGGTALYQSTVKSADELDRAVHFYHQRTRRVTHGKLLVLIDGVNMGAAGTPEDVKKALGRFNPNLYTTVFVYFSTGQDKVQEDQIRNLSKQMGFQEFWFFGSDKPLEERQKQFRKKLHFFSSKVV